MIDDSVLSATHKEDLKVSLLPVNIQPDKESNIRYVNSIIDSSASDSVHLWLLPELFSTGLVVGSDRLMSLAEDNDGSTMSELKSLAESRQVAICGSFLACDSASHFFNRAFIVTSDGRTCFYDKRHLFSLGPESSTYTQGASLPPVITYHGWRLCPIVCYDLRFPAWCRNIGLDYDILLVPANWPSSRQHAWHTLLSARAIENQAYVLGCNRDGTDSVGNVYPPAMSTIYDFMGRSIDSESSTYPTATLSSNRLFKARNNFRPWADADIFHFDDLV